MLTQLEVYNSRVIVPPLTITDGPEIADLLQILNIEGLGPVQANINTTGYMSLDGESFDGSNVGKRNIVLTIRLNPDWIDQTVESLRKILYLYFMPKSKVTLQFTSSHMEQVAIDGYVESFEPNIFTKDSSVAISVICPQPAFIATRAQTIHGVTVLTSDPTETEFVYQGTNDGGFVLEILADASTLVGEDISITNATDNTETFILHDLAGTLATSKLVYSTAQSDKYIKYRRTDDNPSGEISLLKYVLPGSKWLRLENGTNKIRVVSDTADTPWVLTYQARYGGI